MSAMSRGVVPGIVAAAVLGLVLFETSVALRGAGLGFQTPSGRRRTAPDPYARLDDMIADGARDALPSTLRDPFGYGSASRSSDRPRVAVRKKIPPVVEKPMPVLTAVVSDADPQAVIRFQGRNYTVRTGSLFADFRVVSISSDQVVLDENGEQIVLRRVTKGE